VLVLLTGLREKRDFFGILVFWIEEGSIPEQDRVKGCSSACESPCTDTNPDCDWSEQTGVGVP